MTVRRCANRGIGGAPDRRKFPCYSLFPFLLWHNNTPLLITETPVGLSEKEADDRLHGAGQRTPVVSRGSGGSDR